jgi:hypothetical protein
MMAPAEIRAEWCAWWRRLDPIGRGLPAALAILLPGLHWALGGLRGDHLALAAAALAIYYAGPRLRAVGKFLLPLLIMLVVYDAQRYWVAGVRGPIRVAEPQAWELAWFGLSDAGRLVTPAAWWQTRTHAALDLICGAVYLAFVPGFLLAAAWWRFGEKRTAAQDVMWAMLGLNLLGYAIYLLYPAAPPWYADRYGLGPAVLTAAPEAAGALRFDSLLGVTWFADYYGRNANVFGAIPSLHVGQTFLAVLFAWHFRSLRGTTTGFWLLMTFASVYLNHHYIVDGIAGMGCAAAAYAVTVAWGRAIRAGTPGDRGPGSGSLPPPGQRRP